MTERHPQAELIPSYLYGELVGSDAEAVRLHLVDCADCATEVADFEQILGTLRRARPAAEERLSEDLRSRVISLATRRMKVRRFSFRLRTFATPSLVAAAAAGIFVAIVGTVVLRQERAATPPQSAQELRRETPPPPALTKTRSPAAPAPAATKLDSESRDAVVSGRMANEKVPDGVADGSQSVVSVGGAQEASLPPAPSKEAGEKKRVEEQSVREDQGRAAEEKRKQVPVDELGEQMVQMHPGTAGEEPLRMRQVPNGVYAPAPPPAAEPTAANAKAQEAEGDVELPAGKDAKVLQLERKQEAPAAASPTTTKVDPQFRRALKDAQTLLASGDRQRALDSYRNLIKRYPAREKEILSTIGDATLLAAVKVK